MTPADSVSDNPASPMTPIDQSLFEGVPVPLDVHLGRTTLSVAEILALKPGAVVTLEAALDTFVELRFDGRAIARGEIVTVDDKFAIRLVEVGRAGDAR